MPMPDRSLMDRLGNLPVVGGVFVFLTSIGGLVVALLKRESIGD